MTSPVAAGRIALLDGTILGVRPIAAGDAARLVRFHESLSNRTVYLRFFRFHPVLDDEEVDRFTHVDHTDREAIVATCDDEIVGVARYDRLGGSGDAEAAFVVADRYQGRGLGSALFQELAARARAAGVQRFVAETLPDNSRMLAVFHHAGLPVRSRFVGGVVAVTVEL